MPYRCYIIDDEPIAIDVIRAHLEKFDDFEVAGAFEDPVEAFEAQNREPADLLFLDIEMPELSGLELLRALRRPVDVILTTAHREFAVEGFELSVIDYLLKPIAFDRFLQAIDKFLEKQPPSSPKSHDSRPRYLTVRADRKSVRVNIGEIRYIEGLKDYVKIYTDEGRIVTKSSIGQIEERLPAEHFLRIHRSFIVNKERISAFTATDVEVGDQLIPIGRTYRRNFHKSMS